ncbi:MAG: carbamoyltransferase HypF [Gammaproteobacteria bacterium]|nr:carbamoyltransferase HypF [Gammaproteobacteria bacterium]MDH5800696.1 carbamoyltransferase HypF [Gammaproteobacteria bacterium]
MTVSEPLCARFTLLNGHVQGVGFRPFVYRLARRYGVNGWVENRMGQVAIHAEASARILKSFHRHLLSDAPYHARANICSSRQVRLERFDSFSIRASRVTQSPDIGIVPDLPLCEDCLGELYNPHDRRYLYPFINCTNCGPRYTLIRDLPYDRCNTTMDAFALCEFCQREYLDPMQRRYHAEPIACPQCGPHIEFAVKDSVFPLVGRRDHALGQCIEAFNQGKTVAVKGVGGYHLMCDARNDRAVQSLRERKPRPDKPLAVMLLPQQLSAHVTVTAVESQCLLGISRPIVLVQKASCSGLSKYIAPGLETVGLMLPYSPLHYLLLQQFGGPLVATSANLSGEPVITENLQVEKLLGSVCDACLHHNRPIQRPADDPVYCVIDKKPRPIRLGRGNTPLELDLPFHLDQVVLAVGGHSKNTIALAWGRRALISPHIGDLSSVRSMEVFQQTITELQRLYHVDAEIVVCDAHPGYASHRWAKNSGLPVQSVYHHHSHAAQLAGEFAAESRWLIFTWDGVGLGEDTALWGGEALLGEPGAWQRVGSIKPFYLPGGDKAARQPWRSAASLCWEAGLTWRNHTDVGLAYEAWQRKLNCPQSSAVGRLFDAAAALLGLVQDASYEAQAPMLLENLARQGRGQALHLPLHHCGGLFQTDWRPLLPLLMDESIAPADRARSFHESLGMSIVAQALAVRRQGGEFAVGLSGGVFQNRLLTELTLRLLREQGFRCYLPEQVPLNDAGLSFGQIVELNGLWLQARRKQYDAAEGGE